MTASVDTLDAEIAALAPAAIEEMNDEHEDSIVFAARVLTGSADVRTAWINALDRFGVDVVLGDGEGRERPARIEFAAPVDSVLELAGALFGLVTRAREESGEDGTTSAERELAEMSSIRTFLAEVVAVEDVHQHLRRVVVAGDDLTTFAPTGPDTFVYVLLPPPGRGELTIDQSFTWEGYEAMPAEDRPVGAYYTVRAWDPMSHTLTMLMVLHGDCGPASAWAARAQPGDPLALWGPRTAYHPPEDADWHLLVADETGLPAVATILEELPSGSRARVFAEVADPSERQDLPEAPGFDVTWLYRDGAPAGTTTVLADAVRAMPWPGGTPYVWGGGASRAMTAVRRYVRTDRGLPRSAVSLVAYWRHATTPPEA